VVRTVAEASTYAYGRAGDSVWIHLYGGSTLDTHLPAGGRVKLTQTTDYPWDGRVKITLDAVPEREFALKLRIPHWARGAILSVNGKAWAETPAPGRYMEVRRKWAARDVVELELPLRVRLLQAHPLVEEARNQVAVQRGPLVYCLESIDLDKGGSVQDIRIPRGIELKPRFEPKLLGGVTLLEGKAEAAGDPAWGRELYRELPVSEPKSVVIRLIPYYAWGNRGSSEMTVWLPLGR
jgi:DUF1680 family protein